MFERLARELGLTNFYWNALHEVLAKLYSDQSGLERKTALMKWHQPRNDRKSRQLLRLVNESAACTAGSAKQKAFCGEVIWILDECDTLAGDRNNIVHAPLTYTLDQSGPSFTGDFRLGNPLADNLSGDTLRRELTWYRECIYALADYADHLHQSLGHLQPDLPRPALPPRP